jgi:hypothetical protein
MKYQVTLTLLEPMLGTVPKDPEVYASHIMTKAALTDEQAAEELESVEHAEEKGWTGFHQVDGKPIIYDYVVKGFFKDACGMLRRVDKSESSKVRAYKKEIDGLVFITPRQIPIRVNGDGMGVLERPLRAQTAQGERVTLARSDTVPAGTVLEFTINALGGSISEQLLREWLDYGENRGLGQWRNAGYGRFSYTINKLGD